MNVDHILKIIKKQHNVLDIVDLGELSESPGKAYHFFNKNYKDTYANNDRIVIYTQHTVPANLVKHILDTINFIDIDSFFILFCTPQSIHDILDKIPNNKFQNKIIPIKNSKEIQTRYYIPQDTFCAIPWNNIEIRQDGSIDPCCMSKNHALGHITNTKISDAFNNEKMQELRTSLISGIKHPACTICWQREEKNLTSIRQHNAKRLKQQFLTQLVDEPKITSLDIKFNNTCNFSCLICNPGASSMRAIEDQKFKNIPIKPIVNWSDSENFLTQVNDLLPNLQNIDMYGGEPFLIKKFKNVLKTAVEKGYAKNIRLHYNSNGSIWPDSFIDYWPYFKQVDIHFSIDAVGKQFEYQRGGSWSDVDENIQRIKNLQIPNMSINIMPAISILNVYYFDQVVDWAIEKDFSIFESHVITPSGFSITNLTKSAKELIFNKYKNYDKWPKMKDIIDTLSRSKDSDGKDFIKEISYFDRARNRNFADDHEEIAIAMGYKL